MRNLLPYQLTARNLRRACQQVRQAYREGGSDQAVDLIETAGDVAPARITESMTRQLDRLLGFRTRLR